MKNKDGEPTYNQPRISLARRKQGMGKELAILERSAFLLRVGLSFSNQKPKRC